MSDKLKFEGRSILADIADNLMKNIAKKTIIDWTPGRPSTPGRYLVTYNSGEVGEATLHPKYGICLHGIIAYASMPEPYKVPAPVPPKPLCDFWLELSNDAGGRTYKVWCVPGIKAQVEVELKRFGLVNAYMADEQYFLFDLSPLYDVVDVMVYLHDLFGIKAP